MNISVLQQKQIGLIGINKSSGKKSEHNSNSNEKVGKSKADVMIDSLNQQKEALEKSKGSAMAHALETNEGKASLDDKLAQIDKQIKEIDKQISSIKIENQREALGTQDKSKNSKLSQKRDEQNGNKSDDLAGNVNSILLLNNKLKKGVELYKQAAADADELNTLKSNIKLDEQRGVNPVRARERASELEDRVEDIYKKFGESIKDVNSKNGSASNKENVNNAKIENANKSASQRIIQNYKGKIKGYVNQSGIRFDKAV